MPPPALRIMHIAAPSMFGGLERVVQGLARGQRGAGHDVTVVAVLDPADAEHPFVAELRAAGVPVTPLVITPRAYLRERRLVLELCRRLRPDIVHTHGYRPDVLDAAMARSLGIPVVTTVHGFTGGDWKNRLFEHLQRRAMRKFDAVVAVSRAQMTQLVASGVDESRLEQVQNAWSPHTEPALDRQAARAALGVPNGSFTIGWVGRLAREKGADVLLDALARLRHPDWNAVVIGDGGQRTALEQDAVRRGLAARVQWRGASPGAHRLYPAFDVFVLSSRTEGIPIVLFEAISAGVPIVATAVGGVPEVVTEVEARLVPSENGRALAAAIEAIAADPAGAEARATAARRVLATRFDSRAWLARYEQIYRRLLARRPAAGAAR